MSAGYDQNAHCYFQCCTCQKVFKHLSHDDPRGYWIEVTDQDEIAAAKDSKLWNVQTGIDCMDCSRGKQSACVDPLIAACVALVQGSKKSEHAEIKAALAQGGIYID